MGKWATFLSFALGFGLGIFVAGVQLLNVRDETHREAVRAGAAEWTAAETGAAEFKWRVCKP